MAEKVVLYSTGCPKCKVLEQKLRSVGIEYTVDSDVEEMLSLGIENVPMLRIGDKLMDFLEAVVWLNEQ